MRARLGLAAAVAAVLSSSPAAAQFFSPGPLSRAHAGLEGLEKCTRCHEENKGLSARLCLDCHTELRARVAKGTGFHGRMPAAKKQDCASCHPDHRGLGFVMIEWEGGRDTFDHRRTGWPLEGGHAKVRCEGCHQRALVADPAVRAMLEKEPRRTTFLGAPTRCGGCHFDEHRGQLAGECQRCHTATAWKPAPGFNHQATDYPLRGKHREVPCGKCHPTATDEEMTPGAFPKPRAASFLQMKPIEHDSCESCHEDPHKGSLGPNCSGCHSEVGWKIIDASRGQDTSFHDKTKFPLRGAHAGVACKSCHGPFPGQPARFKHLPFAACSDCHEDAHLGQLRPRPPAKVVACDGCHTVNAFAPARYELEQHQTTRFPLDGAHAAVACRGCHPVDPGLAARIPAAVHQKLRAHRRPEEFSFAIMHPRKAPQACKGCHEDVHHGQFEGAGGAADDGCARCHKTTSFTDLRFNHDKDSRFPLAGKHAEVACGACHRRTRVGAGPPFIRYKPVDVTCGSCHTDYHQGQFLLTTDIARDQPAPAARDCGYCHEPTRFKDTVFLHDDPKFSSYPLEGKHAGVKCGRCHRPVRIAGAAVTVRYRPMPRLCEDCHADFHHGEFKGFEP